MGLAPLPTRERVVEVVRASLWIGEPADPKDRNRSAGQETAGCVVAVSGDGGPASRSRAEDRSEDPMVVALRVNLGDVAPRITRLG